MRSLHPVFCSIFLAILTQNAVAEQPAPLRWLFEPTPTAVPGAATPAVLAQAAPAPAAPQKPPETRPPEKVETINFDNWILSCRELVDAPKKRACSMTVALRRTENNQTVFSWTVRKTDNGQVISVIETLPGVSIAPGIQLKLENVATPRKFPIEICEPSWCSGTLAMDKAFIHEASSSSKVTISMTSSAGQPVNFEFPMKGFDKAFARM